MTNCSRAAATTICSVVKVATTSMPGRSIRIWTRQAIRADPVTIVQSTPGGDFGVFVDNGQLVDSNPDGLLEPEDTGLNRMLGNVRGDYLLGGTGVDFLYGNGGEDVLLNRRGHTFESLDEGFADDAWKEYAVQTGQVWYVGGSNADDRISVDFVTEPGLLADHHLITRLTENNGNFSFAASVRLDFQATDADGNQIWDPQDVLFDFATLQSALQADPEGTTPDVAVARTDLVNGLLPPEGEFLAIIVDALQGDDEIIVGPTVQKTVWVDAGPGDDRVEILSGNAILTDRAEIGAPEGRPRGRNDIPQQAFDIDLTNSNVDGVILSNLTIDNPRDEDWFRFTPTGSLGSATFTALGASIDDDLTVSIFNANGTQTLIDAAHGPVDLSSLVSGQTYLLQVTSDLRPTIYDLRYDRGVSGPLPVINMALREDPTRRDVIIGGVGNDILIGGPGEDWIFGGPAAVLDAEDRDVISGGLDRQAGDFLFGGADDDSFQIMPDALPQLSNQRGTLFEPGGQTFVPTTSDQLFGNAGDDQVIFAGGDRDRNGRVVDDFVMLRYNTGLHRYEFGSLVWDSQPQANQTTGAFATKTVADTDLVVFDQHFLFYQTTDIERTVITTGAGDDVVHLDPGYQLLPVAGTFTSAQFETWGINPGDRQQGGSALSIQVFGGDGDDRIFGSPLSDKIDGGAGRDLIIGNAGDDKLEGGAGNDEIHGGQALDPDIDGDPAAFGVADILVNPYRFEAAPPLLITPPPLRRH